MSRLCASLHSKRALISQCLHEVKNGKFFLPEDNGVRHHKMRGSSRRRKYRLRPVNPKYRVYCPYCRGWTGYKAGSKRIGKVKKRCFEKNRWKYCWKKPRRVPRKFNNRMRKQKIK